MNKSAAHTPKKTNMGTYMIVDGSEILRENHPGCIKPVLNNGINYQPQLVSRISSINSVPIVI